jgi:hypothetical protein
MTDLFAPLLQRHDEEPLHAGAADQFAWSHECHAALKSRNFCPFVINLCPAFSCRFNALKHRNDALKGRTKFRRKLFRDFDAKVANWEAAGEADCLLVKRESVIAPLAAQFFRPG